MTHLIKSDDIAIRPGSMADYAPLAQHHYRSGRPCTAVSVWTAVLCEQTVRERFLGEPARERVVGVLVVSLPSLSCSLRDLATAGRYRNLGAANTARALNAEVRTISRVIVDPRFRGLGLAVLLVRRALAEATTVYTEALAAMGRINPFFEHAGMVRYERPPRPEHQRLLDVMAELEIPHWLTASPMRLEAQLRAHGDARRAWFEEELRRWAAAVSRTPARRRSRLTWERCVQIARDELLLVPVYYLHRKESP